MKTLLETSPNTFARIAGLTYILIAIAGGFSMGCLPTIITASDASTTANNILANKNLFITGIFADVVVFMLELVVTTMLYMLLSPVNKSVALITVFARFSMVTVIAVNTLFDITSITLLTNPAFATAFDTTQLQGLVLMFTTLEHFGVSIWQFFFTAHLLALGYLVIKSGLLPSFLNLGHHCCPAHHRRHRRNRLRSLAADPRHEPYRLEISGSHSLKPDPKE